MSNKLVRMRAPTGEERDVPATEVTRFRKAGAVVIATPRRETPVGDAFDDPSRTFSKPGSPYHPMERRVRGFVGGAAQGLADYAQNARAKAVALPLAGGDWLRRQAGMERVIDTPQAQEWLTENDTFSGKVGGISEQMLELGVPVGRLLAGAKAANMGVRGTVAAESALGAVQGAAYSGGDPTMTAIGAAAPVAFGAATAARPWMRVPGRAAIGAGAGALVSDGDPATTMAGAAAGGASVAIRPAARMARGAASGAAEGGFGGMVAGAVRKVAPEDPFDLIIRAAKPRNSLTKFPENIRTAAPRVKAVATERGLPLENIDDVLTATKAAKKVVRARFDDIAGPSRKMGVDLSPVADNMIASLPETLAIDKPAVYQRMVERAGRYRRTVTLEKAEKFLTETNARLEGRFAKFPMSSRKQLLADPRIAAIDAQAVALRDTIYGALDHPSLPQSARQVNREYGQLMEFEDTLIRRRNVAGRQQPDSLVEQMGKVAGAGLAARGAVRAYHGDIGGLADLAGARAGVAASKFVKEQNTTDALLRRAFKNLTPADGFAPVVRRPVAGLLPPSSARVGAGPDDSYVVSPPHVASEGYTGPERRGANAGPPNGSIDLRRDDPLGLQPNWRKGDVGAAAARMRNENPNIMRDAAAMQNRAQGSSTVLGVASPAAAQAIPDNPDSEVDDYARTGLNILGVGALAKAAGVGNILRTSKFLTATMGDTSARRAAKFLTPAELDSQLAGNAKENMRAFSRARAEMPSVDELSSAVVGGREKRGWYQKSRAALQDTFDDDADLFAGVLASTSPQNSVEMNLQNALGIYRNWIAAGRPTTREAIVEVMGRSVKGNKGADSVLDAWINNTVEVLQGGNVISGPKVDSFWTNLRSRSRQTSMGDVAPEQAVTLDAWMANLFGIDQAAFAGRGANFAKANPGYSPQYLAGSSLVRETAKKLGVAPAEVQETAWSFGKALFEKAESLGLSAREVVERGLLTPADISGTVDFSRLLQQPDYAGLLSPKHAKRAKTMRQIDVPGLEKPNPAQQRWMLKAADRLDGIRAKRGVDSRFRMAENAEGRVVAALPMEAATPPSNRSRVGPSGFDASRTQGQQDRLSSSLLNSGEDLAARDVVASAVFPGNVGSTRRGVGSYMGQHNTLRTTPVDVGLDASGRVQASDERGLRAVSGIKSALLGQDAVVVSALDFKSKLPKDAVRITTPNTIPRDGLDQIEKSLPKGEWALQHRGDSLDVLKLNGAMTDEEAEAVQNVVRQHVPMKATTAKRSQSMDKMIPARAGSNVVSPDSMYREVPWGEVGSKDVTRWMMADYDALPVAARRRLDGAPVRQHAADLLEKYSADQATRPDHLNMLRVIATQGLSALRRSMDDPSQLLPVLAMLGLAPTLSRAVGPPTGRQDGSQ